VESREQRNMLLLRGVVARVAAAAGGVCRQHTRIEDVEEQRLFLRESRAERWRLAAWRRFRYKKKDCKTPRVHSDLAVGSGLWSAAGGGRRHVSVRGPPVDSLNQLYVQARFMDVVLRNKVLQWATPCNGGFHAVLTDEETNSARWRSVFVHADEEGELSPDQVSWARVKNPRRAVEKMLRVYDMDPSRLVDITRQSIYFDSVEELRLCLELIESDPHVVIERIKNRLDPNYDPTITGGYRDCALNVRIVTDETRRCRTDLHVCEVQLVLKRFAELKSTDGHKGYVALRNNRGQ